MKNVQAGVIPLIPLLVVGVVLLVGGGSVVGYRVYQTQKSASLQMEQAEIAQVNADKERLALLEEKLMGLEALQRSATTSETDTTKDDLISKEIEALKSQNSLLKKSIQQKPTPTPVVIVEKPTPPSAPPPQSSTRGLSNAELISLVRPGVVAIDSRVGRGSGFLVAKNFVITNAHVVEDVYRVNVRLDDGTVVIGYIAAIDVAEDIAVISIPATTNTPLSFGDSDSPALNQGDSVYAFGFPFGLTGDVSFKEGTLSRRFEYDDKKYLEISNTILPGNSGGPLINDRGVVVGINTLVIAEHTADGTQLGESIKLAIPANHAKKFSSPMLARAHPPSAEKKKQIDDFEDYMVKLHEADVAYSDAMWHYDYAMSNLNTEYFTIAYNELGNSLAIAKKLVVELPELYFTNSLKDAAYAMQKIAENMRDITLNEALRYVKSKHAQSSTLEADKAFLDKRIEGQKKKFDEYNLFLDIINKEAKKLLIYY